MAGIYRYTPNSSYKYKGYMRACFPLINTDGVPYFRMAKYGTQMMSPRVDDTLDYAAVCDTASNLEDGLAHVVKPGDTSDIYVYSGWGAKESTTLLRLAGGSNEVSRSFFPQSGVSIDSTRISESALSPDTHTRWYDSFQITGTLYQSGKAGSTHKVRFPSVCALIGIYGGGIPYGVRIVARKNSTSSNSIGNIAKIVDNESCVTDIYDSRMTKLMICSNTECGTVTIRDVVFTLYCIRMEGFAYTVNTTLSQSDYLSFDSPEYYITVSDASSTINAILLSQLITFHRVII